MAKLIIAGTNGAGKIFYDNSAILREAHTIAENGRSTNRAWRSYRHAFAQALKRVWYQARLARAQAEIEAEEANPITLPANIVGHCNSLRLEASYEPHTFAGHERFNALHREADRIANSAHAVAISSLTASKPSPRISAAVVTAHSAEVVPFPRAAIARAIDLQQDWRPYALPEDDFDDLTARAAVYAAPKPSANETVSHERAWSFLFNGVCRVGNALPDNPSGDEAMAELNVMLSFLEEHAPA